MQSTRARAAARWFIRSGIQDPQGGFARYYRGDLGRYARVSTEITGYAISALVYLFDRTGDEECLASAIRAGDFLIHCAWDEKSRLFPFEYSREGEAPEPLAYFFDSGIIVRGLLALWRATDNEKYLERAVCAGESMRRHFVDAGTIHPILRLPSCSPLPYESQWSRQPGCYQLKSAMSWWDLGRETNDARFFAWYEEALARALATHRDFLPAATPEKTMDRLHAYAYFLEGSMPAADRPEVCAAVGEGIGRISFYLREIAPVFERSDVNAQLLRVRLIADQAGVAPLDRGEAEREARRVTEFQMGGPDPRAEGGYAFGRKQGEIIPHMNPVSTAFCSQALEMWQDYKTGRQLDLPSLI